MKRFYISFITTCLLITSVNGGYSQNVNGGVVGGINLTQVEGDNTHGFYNLGVNAGGTVDVPLSPKFSLSLELVFSQKGATTYALDNIGFAPSYNLVLDYVEAPFMINFHDKKQINFGAGMALGVLVRAEETVPNYHFQEKYPYNQLDYNLIIGGNYFVTPHIGVNIRWGYSIVAIRQNPPQFNKSTQLNHVVTLRGIYYFNKFFQQE